jgi:hypothetical protein
MSTQHYAECANELKDRWVRQLEEAEAARNWDLVLTLLQKMKLFQFTE